jgi:site-specific recombinase XerD
MSQELQRVTGHLEVSRPGRLSPAARAAVVAGMPAETQRAYRGDVRRFEQWCRDAGQPCLPADADTLAEYASHLAYDLGRSPVTLERARWAILKWHELAGMPAPGTAGLVSVLRGYREHLATTHSPKASPVRATAASRDTLAVMLGLIDRDTLAGCRDAAILLGGFSFGGRRSEISSLNISSIEHRAEGMQITVYRKKTRKMDDPVVKYRPGAALCPVRAVVAWTQVLASGGRTAGPMFVRIDRHGTLAPQLTRNGVPIGSSDGRMTGQAIADVIRRRALAAGLGGKWSGHSVRRGLATEMHRAGAERRAIERQGGWSENSRAVAGYIDDADRWLDDVLEGVL